MTDTTPTEASRNSDPIEPESGEQAQEDQGGSSNTRAPQTNAGSSGRRSSHGPKKPWRRMPVEYWS